MTASTNRILRRKALNKIIIIPPFCLCFNHIFLYLLAGFGFLALLPIYAFARCYDKRISCVKKRIRLTYKNDILVQIGYFTSFCKENTHGNKNVI